MQLPPFRKPRILVRRLSGKHMWMSADFKNGKPMSHMWENDPFYANNWSSVEKAQQYIDTIGEKCEVVTI